MDVARWHRPVGAIGDPSSVRLGRTLRLYYRHVGLRCAVWLRIGQWFRRHGVRGGAFACQRLIYRRYGLDIVIGRPFGGGLYIAHPSGVTLAPRCMGENCSVIAAVTVGMRNERYHKYRYVAYGIIALSMLFFIYVVRRIKSLWVAQCLGQIFMILGSQLTCYYYSFMILSAPLIKLRKPIEVGLFTLAAITQIIWMQSTFNDNKYTLLTIVSLIFCYFMIGHFWRRKDELEPEEELLEDEDDEEAAAAA